MNQTLAVKPKKTTLLLFRQVATIEGLSMIILLTFSVLKRTTDFAWAPLGVTYVGWLHGLLVVMYCYMLYLCWDKYDWSFKRVILFFLGSLLPFVPFFIERKLKEEQ